MPQAMNTPTNLQLPPRRLQQFEASADRKDILAVDGNAKLHRRSCGMPFAEVLPSPHLNKVLLRGCSCRPHGKDTLCKKHAAALHQIHLPRYLGTGSGKLCTMTVMCATLKFKSLASLAGSLRARSTRMYWPNILPFRPIATYEGEDNGGQRPAGRNGRAFATAGRVRF